LGAGNGKRTSTGPEAGDIIVDTNKSISEATLSRRSLLKASAAGATALTSVSAGARASDTNKAHDVLGPSPADRRVEATRVRLEAGERQLLRFFPRQRTNGDDNYADKRASFTKALPHNEFGEVDTAAYQTLLDALDSGEQDSFDTIRLDPTADRKLANPQGAFKFSLAGADGHNTYMRPAPKFDGAETAAEMGELYWKALCRDVPFSEYQTNSLIGAAVSDLNAFSETVGPLDNGAVTRNTIFRGETPGDLTGPYISQLLLKPIPYGNHSIEQKYEAPALGADFMTSHADWLAVQRGVAPAPLLKSSPRYISDARALGEYVHLDFSYQAYMSAALILLGVPGSGDVANPYNGNPSQGAFVSFGGPDVLNLVAQAAHLALAGAWYQKWLVHRRARPEVYAGRLHHQMNSGRDYGLPGEIGMSDGVGRVLAAHGTALLPMAFPEGSPTHPSYPAGHATIAGACATVLKAYFEEDVLIPDPVETDATGAFLLPYNGTVTIGDEINKLANNIALGRDWAGVHYRSDGVDGLEVGEQQAIQLLSDYSRTVNERFDGYTLTKFSGEKIYIRRGQVRAVSA